MKRLLLFIAVLFSTAIRAQVAPSLYYQFENPTPLASTVGGAISANGAYTITASDVGTAITWSSNAGSYLQAPSLSGANVSVQFLWKSNYETARGTSTKILTWGNLGFGFTYPYIYFNTQGSDVNIGMYGANNMAWETIMSGQWVHFALVYSGSSKKLWINGQKVYDALCTSGTITGQPIIGSSVDYVKIRGSIDELAFYTATIPDGQIYQNYLDWQGGAHYQTATTAVISGPATTLSLDTNEFTLDIPRNLQLSKYPAPRYKPGNTLLKNFNWFDPLYLAGAYQSGVGTDQSILAVAGNQIQKEMATNWNYYYDIKLNTNSYMNQQAIVQANANPQWKFQTIVLRSQYSPLINSQSLPADHYLQNSFSQPIDINGGVITSGNKVWRPTAPVSSYNADGALINTWLNTLSASFNHTFSMVNENGELFPFITDNALSKDPQVVSAKNASGLSYQAFLARKYAENETGAYRDMFMSNAKTSTAKFTEYAIDGYPQYRFTYSEARKVNHQINSQYYSTGDFYPRWPSNWRNFVAAWHGWQWFVDSRYNEIALGDKLFSPFVSAGWDATEENNIRPGQWMGLLKSLLGMGAEFYYGGFFSLEAPWPDSKNWIWQVSTPSYVQAIGSRVEQFLRSGSVMDGDIPGSYVTNNTPGYNFYSGRSNTLVVVRKMTGQEKYFITATLQPNSNTGYTPLEDTCTIRLAGADVKIKARRQGSCYVWDRTVTPNTFVQLDAWHEYKHPSRWSTDLTFDAEVTDGGTGTTKTTATGTDYTSFTSYYKGVGQYQFLVRDTANYYLYMLSRADSATSIVASIGSVVDTVCIDSTGWKWARFNTTGIKVKFALGSPNAYTLNINTGAAEVDKIVLSKDSVLYSPTASSCSVTPPAPVCSWVTGSWSAWGTCNGTYQVRTRTVTSSLSGCTPPEIMPAASDTQACVIVPPTCYWSAGPWSGWTICAADTQYRTRTVVSTISGCTPSGTMPDTIEVQACSSTIAGVSNLVVVNNRWYSTRIEWQYPSNSDLFQVQLIDGTKINYYNYDGVTRRVTYILYWRRTYKFKIRVMQGTQFSPWQEVTFKTR